MGNVYNNKNQLLLKELVKIYMPDEFDWLSYQITKSNILTLHHVLKVAEGGQLSKENAALLTKRAHRALNICENRDFILYLEINDFFREIIAKGEPLDDYFKEESKQYKHALIKTLYK